MSAGSSNLATCNFEQGPQQMTLNGRKLAFPAVNSRNNRQRDFGSSLVPKLSVSVEGEEEAKTIDFSAKPTDKASAILTIKINKRKTRMEDSKASSFLSKVLLMKSQNKHIDSSSPQLDSVADRVSLNFHRETFDPSALKSTLR